jgi:hypothetical protein
MSERFDMPIPKAATVVHQRAFGFTAGSTRLSERLAAQLGLEAVAFGRRFTVDNGPYPIATRKRVSDCGQGPVIMSHRVHGGWP